MNKKSKNKITHWCQTQFIPWFKRWGAIAIVLCILNVCAIFLIAGGALDGLFGETDRTEGSAEATEDSTESEAEVGATPEVTEKEPETETGTGTGSTPTESEPSDVISVDGMPIDDYLATYGLEQYESEYLTLNPVENVLYVPFANGIEIYYAKMQIGWISIHSMRQAGWVNDQHYTTSLFGGAHTIYEELEVETEFDSPYLAILVRRKDPLFGATEAEWLAAKDPYITANEVLEMNTLTYEIFYGNETDKYGYWMRLSTYLVNQDILGQLILAVTLNEQSFTQEAYQKMSTPGKITGNPDTVISNVEIKWSDTDTGLDGQYHIAVGDTVYTVPEGTVAIVEEDGWALYAYVTYNLSKIGTIDLYTVSMEGASEQQIAREYIGETYQESNLRITGGGFEYYHKDGDVARACIYSKAGKQLLVAEYYAGGGNEKSEPYSVTVPVLNRTLEVPGDKFVYWIDGIYLDWNRNFVPLECTEWMIVSDQEYDEAELSRLLREEPKETAKHILYCLEIVEDRDLFPLTKLLLPVYSAKDTYDTGEGVVRRISPESVQSAEGFGASLWVEDYPSETELDEMIPYQQWNRSLFRYAPELVYLDGTMGERFVPILLEYSHTVIDDDWWGSYSEALAQLKTLPETYQYNNAEKALLSLLVEKQYREHGASGSTGEEAEMVRAYIDQELEIHLRAGAYAYFVANKGGDKSQAPQLEDIAIVFQEWDEGQHGYAVYVRDGSTEAYELSFTGYDYWSGGFDVLREYLRGMYPEMS